MNGTIHLKAKQTHKTRLWQWRVVGKTNVYKRNHRKVYLPETSANYGF